MGKEQFMGASEMDALLTYRKPTDDQTRRFGILNARLRELNATIIETAPPSRLRDQALLKLLEVRMCANGAIATEDRGAEPAEWSTPSSAERAATTPKEEGTN